MRYLSHKLFPPQYIQIHILVRAGNRHTIYSKYQYSNKWHRMYVIKCIVSKHIRRACDRARSNFGSE